MFNMYVVAVLTRDRKEQRDWIKTAILMQDWYTSEISALATMDQYNYDIIEKLSKERYEKGDFHLYGVFRFEFLGAE